MRQEYKHSQPSATSYGWADGKTYGTMLCGFFITLTLNINVKKTVVYTRVNSE